MSQLSPGATLGAYEIVGHIATGGMGSVYEARNRITGEARALKVMRPDLASKEDFVQRFIREIRLAMSIEHPNLVRVFEPGMHGDVVFLPMELLEGETLTKYLKHRGALPESEALAIAAAIGSALAALHDKQILHRDVKPSNVFLARTPSGVVPKVLDLGAARTAEATEELTATGLAIGSPHYMAPEQASGAKNVDHRADQYALGVVLYQMLTATRPYENDDTGHVLAKLLANVPYPPPRVLNPAISENVERVVVRAMSRTAAERFPSVREMLAALQGAPFGHAMAAFEAELPPPEPTVTRVGPLVPPPAPHPMAMMPMPPPMAPMAGAETSTGPVAVKGATDAGNHWLVAVGVAVLVLVLGLFVGARLVGWPATSAGAIPTTTPVGATASATAVPPPPETLASVAPSAPPAITASSSASTVAAPAPPPASSRLAVPTAGAIPRGTARGSATASAAPCVATPGAPCL